MRRDLAALALGLAALGACKEAPKQQAPSASQEPAVGAPASARSGGSPSDRGAAPGASGEPGEETAQFRVDVTPPTACAANAICEGSLTVTALGPFKVNEEYPHKLVVDAKASPPGLPFEGTGTFTLVDKHTGKLVFRFRAPASGTARVAGRFKLSVCTLKTCHIEEAPVAFEVPVS